MRMWRSPSRGRLGSGVALLLASLPLLLSGCANHTIYHPKRNPPGITTWSEQAVRGRLLLRLQWARPEGTWGYSYTDTLIEHDGGHAEFEIPFSGSGGIPLLGNVDGF